MTHPRELLDVADELIDGPTEAHWRAAVGRAYYAAFHTARELFRTCGFVVPQADRCHVYLTLRLENSGRPDIASAGQDLAGLRRHRNRAEYELNRPLAHTLAFAQVQSAHDVVQLLESVATVPTVQTAITQAMRDYERDVLRDVTWRP